MASIDWGMVGLGAVIGLGCRKQLKAAGRVAAQTAASVAKETAEKQTKSAEESAAEQKLEEINRKIDQLF